MQEEQQLLGEKEVAARLGCSVAALRLWRRQGLPHLKLGRLVRYELHEVLQWFRARAQQEAV